MEYEKLIYTNERGEKIEFSIDSPYFVNVSNDVTGISDVKNKIYTSSSMEQHGETYISQKIEARDINIKGSIRATDRDKIVELRRKAQKVLNPALQGTLTYVYKNVVRVIDCRIDNTPIFNRKKVFCNFTIQFYCSSPFWKETHEDTKNVALWVPTLEFELEIDEEDGIEFGYREPSVIVDVYNNGDVDTGMRIEFRATGTLYNPILLNVNTGEYIQINAKLIADDIVTVNTEYGAKDVTLERDGKIEDYYRNIDVDSTFMQLAVGRNVFRYDADNINALEVTVYHLNKYLGV